ncbi:MAG: UDP-glucose/GDP-mannose dehydrogenase family protein [Kineosporiaceae bacterium]
MRVSIVGTGYVGLVSGVGLAEIGHRVTCIDIDERKVEMIRSASAPIHEPGLDDLLARTSGRSLFATTDLHAAVLDSDLTMIAVGTPFDGERIDLSYIETAAAQIGKALAEKDSYHVVVVKSTVVPGTTRTVVLPILEQASGKRAGVDFGVGMNPEFLAEGNAVVDFMSPDRIVFGGIDQRSQDTLADLYAPFTAADTLRTDTDTAEMIKYSANSLLATLISFSNEIGNLCAEVGVDAVDAMAGVHLDKRLSPILGDGQRVRPGMLSFLAAGCGFGGSCFPKDVKALVAYGRSRGQAMPVLDAVLATNRAQPSRLIELLRRRVPELAGRRVAVLGMAFKPDTDDIRESPALPVTEQLLAAGAQVVAYDPEATENAREVFGDRVRFAGSLADAVQGVDAVVLVTRWAEFTTLPQVLAEAGLDVPVIDGRRLLDKNAFTQYEGIGLG